MKHVVTNRYDNESGKVTTVDVHLNHPNGYYVEFDTDDEFTGLVLMRAIKDALDEHGYTLGESAYHM